MSVMPPKKSKWNSCLKPIGVIVGVVLGPMLLWEFFSGRVDDTFHPVTELPSTHRIRAEDWGDLALEGGYPGTGWVLLPEVHDEPHYQSTVLPESRGFLPAAACRECHESKYASFITTAHASTSAEPSLETILANFQAPRNLLQTADPDFWFTMDHTADGYFQQLNIRKNSRAYLHRRSIDLVLGSGNHGQSYLSWEGDRLYQMHVSYLTELDQWVNSPGMYYDGTADFSRPVPVRCLECHATWFAEARNAVNRFDRHHYLLGVTCVRCHGPGLEHVEYHREFPSASVAHRITNPSTLSQDRLNELCAQCHSAGEPIAPAFTYLPGEPLSHYLELDLAADDANNADPHSANQLARLMKSQCYIKGENLTCITCHDPHADQRGQLADFSRKCLKCHTQEACGESNISGSTKETRCIDCHMPARRDQQVKVETKLGAVTALLRDHKIGVWPLVSEQILNGLQEPHQNLQSVPNPASQEAE